MAVNLQNNIALVGQNNEFAVKSYGVLPPVIHPIGMNGETVFSAGDLDLASSVAVAEFARLLDYRRNFRAPRFDMWRMKPGRTAVGFLQLLRRFVIGYDDTRTLADACVYFDGSAMGPLPIAVDRAIKRNAMRGEGGPAKVLSVGAGWRYVEGGLDELFGDVIEIHESSPKYVTIPDGCRDPVAFTYPEAVIEKADLPAGSFELAYSIIGSCYGRNQVAVLQRVVDSLKVGAELFLMWKAFFSFGNGGLYNAVRRNPIVFQEGGLDLSVEGVTVKSDLGNKVPWYLVHARKRREHVDVGALFQESVGSEYLGVDVDESTGFIRSQVPVRLSYNGPYFGSLLYAPDALIGPIEQMIESFQAELGIDAKTLYYKLTGNRVPTNGFDAERVARHELAKAILKDHTFQDIVYGLPLTIVVLKYLSDVYSVLNKDTTAPQHMLDELIEEATILNYHK